MKNLTFFYALCGFFLISIQIFNKFMTFADILFILGGCLILFFAVREEYKNDEVEEEVEEIKDEN